MKRNKQNLLTQQKAKNGRRRKYRKHTTTQKKVTEVGKIKLKS